LCTVSPYWPKRLSETPSVNSNRLTAEYIARDLIRDDQVTGGKYTPRSVRLSQLGETAVPMYSLTTGHFMEIRQTGQ
jgi:hypothetical protein